MSLKVKTFSAITVSSSGTAVPLSSSSQVVYSLIVQSISTNTGTQYVGDSTVSSSNGIEFQPGDIVEIDAPAAHKSRGHFNLNEIYVDSSTDNAEFRVTAWIEE